MTIGRLFLVLSIVLLVCFGNRDVIAKVMVRLSSFDYFLAPLLILYLVSVLERVLDKFGFIKWIEDFLEAKQLTRLSYAVIPGLIGLIPSIGGAHFACSMFPTGAGKKLSGCRVAAINYFFRHFHVYSNPLIAGTVLACTITNTSLWKVVLNLFPLTVFTLIFGWYFLIPKRSGSHEKKKARPIPIDFKTVAVVATLALPFSKKVLSSMAPSKSNLFLLSEIAFILIFASVINGIGIGRILTEFICNSGIPLWLAFSLITILLAFITGISQAYVAIIMPLVSTIPPDESTLVCWLLALGFYIQYLTPSHLCLVVCADFFKCSVLNLLKQIFLPVTIAFLGWTVLFLVVS